MKKILVVFNICGINQCHVDIWVRNILNIINQDYPNFDLAISGCSIPKGQQHNIANKLSSIKTKKIIYNYIEEILPVNVTFNHTCWVATQKDPTYEGYLYVASDINFGTNQKVISHLVKTHFSSNSGITSAVVDNDSGLDRWFDKSFIEKLQNSNVEVPIGKTLNLHTFLFDKKLYNKFNKKIIPDIFASYCTESTFSFLCASIDKKFVIHNTKEILLKHMEQLDGRSAGFGPEEKRGWEHLFKSKKSVQDRLMTEEAFEVGFGYEELQNIFPHNKKMYVDNQHVCPEKLLDFLRTALFLSKDEFNYKNIKYENLYF